jgi:hypothetical protein
VRHVDQDSVAGPDSDPGGPLGSLQLRDSDLVPERHVREVKADRLGVEVLERHLIDRGRVGGGIEMAGRVDVGAGVVAERQMERLRGDGRVASAVDLVVVVPAPDGDGRVRRVDGHPMSNLAAEVDQSHASPPSRGRCSS